MAQAPGHRARNVCFCDLESETACSAGPEGVSSLWNRLCAYCRGLGSVSGLGQRAADLQGGLRALWFLQGLSGSQEEEEATESKFTNKR